MFCIELVGEIVDIDDFRHLIGNIEWKIIHEDGRYYLVNLHIPGDELAVEFVDTALRFIDVLNGACKVQFPNHSDVGIGEVFKHNEDGSRTKLVILPLIKSQSRVRGSVGVVCDSQNAIRFDDIFKKGDEIPEILDALYFFKEMNWWNLYKVFEIVRQDIGIEGVFRFVKKERINLFTQAAQSKDYIGYEARHAAKKYKAPKEDISLEEACDLIKTLFLCWVRVK